MVKIQTLSFFQLESRPATATTPAELLHDHLKAVAGSARQIFGTVSDRIETRIRKRDLRKVAYWMGATHDIGKGTQFFQDHLHHTPQNIPDFQLLKSHSYISSLYCSWIIQNSNIPSNVRDFLQVSAALGIQGHHGDLKRPSRYLERLTEFFTDRIFERQIGSFAINEMEAISQSLHLPSFRDFSQNWVAVLRDLGGNLRRIENILNGFQDRNEPYFITTMLFSILLDADRINAAQINPRRIAVDHNSVSRHARGIQPPPGPRTQRARTIFNLRRELFRHCNQRAGRVGLNRGRIFTLSAATGLGKTLAALNFATKLRRRIERDCNYSPRIIYVAPFISILDQSSEIFSEVFDTNLQTNLLLIHHHLSQVEYTTTFANQARVETFSTGQSELLLQGWNAEIVVTTFIQFFNSVFGKYTSSLRRLHNLAGSIIILDEVQSVGVEYWGAIRAALLFLANRFDFKIILMTATQPLIFRPNESREIAPTLNVPRRVTYHKHNDRITLADFRDEMRNLIASNPNRSILIELNTVRTAQDVFRSLDPSLNRYFLSSQIVPLDRQPRIEEIRTDLAAGRQTVVVSTQVIEAGVDIDFDIAVRDIGPIDSIIQTAGRCNRNGLRPAAASHFHIYRITNDQGHLFARRIYGTVAMDIAETLLDRRTAVPRMLTQYYQEIEHRTRGITSDEIIAGIRDLDYDDVHEKFRLIDQQYNVSVFVDLDDHANGIWRRFVALSNQTRPSRTELRQLRPDMERYMIGVAETQVTNLGLQEENHIFYVDQAAAGVLYDRMTGFVR